MCTVSPAVVRSRETQPRPRVETLTEGTASGVAIPFLTFLASITCGDRAPVPAWASKCIYPPIGGGIPMPERVILRRVNIVRECRTEPFLGGHLADSISAGKWQV